MLSIDRYNEKYYTFHQSSETSYLGPMFGSLSELSLDKVEDFLNDGFSSIPTKYKFRYSHEYPPSIECCIKGQKNGLKRIELILKYGIMNINFKATSGLTALNVAIYYHRKKIVRFLLDNGADIRLIDYKNRSAIKYAKQIMKNHTSFHGNQCFCEEIKKNKMDLLNREFFYDFFPNVPRHYNYVSFKKCLYCKYVDIVLILHNHQQKTFSFFELILKRLIKNSN